MLRSLLAASAMKRAGLQAASVPPPMTQNAPQIPPKSHDPFASLRRLLPPPAPSAWINSLESRINIGGGRRLRQMRTLSQGEDICLFLACGHTVWMCAFMRVITYVYHEREPHKTVQL